LGVAVYKAAFASAAGSHIFCPVDASDTTGMEEEDQEEGLDACQAANVTPAVMDACHAQGKLAAEQIYFTVSSRCLGNFEQKGVGLRGQFISRHTFPNVKWRQRGGKGGRNAPTQ